jgi:hypothetical protein
VLLCLSIAGALTVTAAAGARRAAEQGAEVWTFDRLDRLGSHPTTLVGEPRVVDTPLGKAVEFDGVDDALFVDVHPLAGADTFTWEAVFRPDGGNVEQRWFHLQEADGDNRMLFEIRVQGNEWWLDSYLHGPAGQKALIDSAKRFPVGRWYHVASVYDGREFRNYVNGVMQGAFVMSFVAQRPGRTSIGVRMNRVNYFRGAIRSARFTRRALDPREFLAAPSPAEIRWHR